MNDDLMNFNCQPNESVSVFFKFKYDLSMVHSENKRDHQHERK